MINEEHVELLLNESGINPEVLALANVRSCTAFPYYD